MDVDVRIVTVDETNVRDEGFFCYKSKPKSQGYRDKLAWLGPCLAEGMRLKILYEGGRSVGFIEYTPGEHSWRVVDAPGYLVIHCLWVVGRGKRKGYGSRLLAECLEDARRQNRLGVAMVSSRGNWLANERVLLKNGFQQVGTAPPSFKLLAKPIRDGSPPSFPDDWDARLARFPSGATILHADQCPYMPNMVRNTVSVLRARGIEPRVIKLESSAQARALSPSAYGVLSIVVKGRLLSYHFLGPTELRRLDEEILGRA